MTYARRTDSTQQRWIREVITQKPRKYRNVPTLVDGIKFASKLEAKRWGELKLLERAGEIRALQRQVRYALMCGDKPILMKSKRYPNGRHVKYVADFVYQNRDYNWTLEDTKGCENETYPLKRAIMQAMGYEIQEIRK
jgi:hypothetical protein